MTEESFTPGSGPTGGMEGPCIVFIIPKGRATRYDEDGVAVYGQYENQERRLMIGQWLRTSPDATSHRDLIHTLNHLFAKKKYKFVGFENMNGPKAEQLQRYIEGQVSLPKYEPAAVKAVKAAVDKVKGKASESAE